MKKNRILSMQIFLYVFFIVFAVLIFIRPLNMNTVLSKPSFVGVVLEANEQQATLRVTDARNLLNVKNGEIYRVTQNVILKDSRYLLAENNLVAVYFDGEITQTSPPSISTVYAFFLIARDFLEYKD